MGDEYIKLNEDEQPVCAQLLQDEKDPLQGVDVLDQTPQYYKLNQVVFAEPISITEDKDTITEADAETEDANEISFVDNVMIHRRSGKRNKYFMDIDLTDLRCPQPACGRTFPSATLLRAHVRNVHCGGRRFLCERCGAAFSAGHLLGRHAAVHGGDKTECPVCNKKLSKRTSLSVHLRSHTNTRPHRCRLCGKTFLRGATLATHVKFVHRTGDLRCERCQEKFPTRAQLLRHKTCLPGNDAELKPP